MHGPVRARWAVDPSTQPRLVDADASSTSGSPGGRSDTVAATEALQTALRSLQDRLWASSTRSVLVVLQGIDASGKDGTISHVFRGLNPLGTRVVAFKAPTARELGHDFLWRVHPHCPARGEIAIFNRSHYEDVLVARVHDLVPKPVWRGRYAHINAFESLLADAGTVLVKLFLHVSKGEQRRRLEEREHDPEKQWKARPEDFAERRLWDEYAAAFEEMLARTSTAVAPWYVVPSDHKWHRNWVVSTILVEVLDGLDLRYPPLSR